MNGRFLDLPKRESSLPFIDTGPVPGGVSAPSGDGPVITDPMAGALVRAYPKKEEGH
jgi:hypothetical protein